MIPGRGRFAFHIPPESVFTSLRNPYSQFPGTLIHMPRNTQPHDLRRNCARMCHVAGGELEQIQFLLGHASVQTTERYLGCKQRLSQAVNDRIGLRL